MALVEKWPSLGEKFLPTMRTRISDLFDMDRFMEDRLFETPFWNFRFMKVPAANIMETDKAFMLELAAPGLEKSDFTVDVKEDILEIKVEKEFKKDVKEDNYTRKEYNFNSFCRTFNLPEFVDEHKIKAKYENGVLLVEIPKVPQAKKLPTKEIKVA